MSAKYEDAYLKPYVDRALEARAYSEVDLYGTFADEWRDRLVVPQAYILICLDKQGAPDDLFTAKLKSYRQEFDRLLAHARVATPDADGNALPIFGIPMERG